MAPSPGPDLLPLVEAALAGSREVMSVYGSGFEVERKDDGSPVSLADRQAEAAILACLKRDFPDLPVVAEEASAAGQAPVITTRFFLVDPLDGTVEFIRRNGEFTVNIALIQDGAPIAGIVLAPALGLAYAGGRGQAWKGQIQDGERGVENWEPIRTRRSAARPVAVASRSHCTPETEAALRLAEAAERRSIGSSLKFCLLAEGTADFYPRLGPTMEWDTAAGDAVLRAAGGAVVTLDGVPLRYGKLGVAGMRDFENPHFLAAGDLKLLDLLVPNAA